MTSRPQQLAEVLLGVAGIWFVASAIPSLTMFLGFFTSAPPVIGIQERTAYLWFGATQVALSLVTGGALLFLRRRIAVRFFAEDSQNVSASGPLQAAAFSVVGALLFSEGLASSVEHLLSLALSTSGIFPSLVGDLAKVTLGAVLFAGGPALAAYWHQVFRRAPIQ